MALALFDLDNTLLDGDSDYLWGCFLVEHGIVDGEHYEIENQRFYDQYLDGSLDIHEFLRFQLAPLREHKSDRLKAWREIYLQEKIDPVLLPKAHQLLEKHRQAGDELLIITATNSGVTHLLATEPETAAGEYTGNVTGTPCFQSGKVERLQDWMTAHNQQLGGSWFYSDSHNDLPLLEAVEHPVAVDPDDKLRTHAQANGWPVISLR
jgi:HAD superfamily hydrolase (TIGR01490 family)